MRRLIITPCRLSTLFCTLAALILVPEHASHLDLWMLPPAVKSEEV